MKLAQYRVAEKAIAAADKSGIRERWLYGLRLLADTEKIAPGGGLKHGVAAELIADAQARGLKLSERELRYRLQCARTYPRDSQIGNAIADFDTWFGLIQSGFPAYDAPADEPLADWRTEGERRAAQARALIELVGGQGALFPLDEYDPTEAHLKDLVDYADRQDSITARFVAHGQKRREYIAQLLAAVGDDESALWVDAHRAAFGDDSDPVEVSA